MHFSLLNFNEMKTQNNSDRQTVNLKIDENKKVQYRSKELMV